MYEFQNDETELKAGRDENQDPVTKVYLTHPEQEPILVPATQVGDYVQTSQDQDQVLHLNSWKVTGKYRHVRYHVYHPDHEDYREVSESERKKLLAEGWYDSPAHFPESAKKPEKALSDRDNVIDHYKTLSDKQAEQNTLLADRIRELEEKLRGQSESAVESQDAKHKGKK